MKKVLSIIIGVLLCFAALSMTACGNENETPKEPTELMYVANAVQTFDEARNGESATQFGIYGESGIPKVQNGKVTHNVAANERLVFSVGDVNTGRYVLTFDAEIPDENNVVLQVVEEVYTTPNDTMEWSFATMLYDGYGKKVGEFANVEGKTHKIMFDFLEEYVDFGIALYNKDDKSCTITLDNISFGAVDYTQKQTVADFESGFITNGNWNSSFNLKHAASANVDIQNGAAVTALDLIEAQEETVDGKINRYYKVDSTTVSYSRLNIGYLSAGTYSFTIRAKVESGNGTFALAIVTGHQNNSQQLTYHSNAAEGIPVEGGGKNPPVEENDKKNAAWAKIDGSEWNGVVSGDNWVTYSCTLELTKEWYVKFGVGNAQKGVVCIDDITVQKIA